MMSSSTTTTSSSDDAKFRRGIAALQKLSQSKRKSNSKMRYNPFSEALFTRKRVGIEEKTLESLLLFHDNKETADTKNQDYSSSPILFDIVKYIHIQSGIELPPIRERSEVSAATVEDLNTAKIGEIDNTGSFHWPAEDILTHLLLSKQQLHGKKNGSDDSDSSLMKEPQNAMIFDFSGDNTKNDDESSRPNGILELGAGIGLAGMFLSIMLDRINNKNQKRSNIFITDGNPRVSKILEVNVRSLSSLSSSTAEAFCLPWQIVRRGNDNNSKNDNNTDDKNSSSLSANNNLLLSKCDFCMKHSKYLVGADCLFFEDFHDDLVELVLRFFRIHQHGGSAHDDDVKVVFVAPSRGGSRERFLKKLFVAVDNVDSYHRLQLKSKLIENYDKQIYEIHQRELANASTTGYDPDRHYPQVVEIFIAKNNK